MKKKKLIKKIEELEQRIEKLENPTAFIPWFRIEDQNSSVHFPCMHDNLKSGEVTAISCPCPKCNIRSTTTSSIHND